jgi:hypothetical protein
MAVTGIEHVYAETTAWDGSLAFWEGLGFGVEARWGSEDHRAARLVSGGAVVVLAEVEPGGNPPACVVHFALEDAGGFAPGPAVTTTPLEPTHWGTRWIRVTDPDGRVHVLEEGA